MTYRHHWRAERPEDEERGSWWKGKATSALAMSGVVLAALGSIFANFDVGCGFGSCDPDHTVSTLNEVARIGFYVGGVIAITAPAWLE